MTERPTNKKTGTNKVEGVRLPRRDFLKVGAAAGLGAVFGPALAACAPSPSTSTPAPSATKTKVLTVGLVGDASNLNPNANPGGSVVVPLYNALYNGLTAIKPDTGEPYARLAESWSVSDDKKTWTFKLRQGVKFHNGEELTADAVKLTFDKAVISKSVATGRMGAGTTVTAVDKYTVAVTTTSPYALMPAVMADFPIYPAKYFGDVGDDGMAKKPVGTGMYKFVSAVTGGAVTLEKFDDYWGAAIGEKPGVDKLIFKPLPEDATRVSALEAKEIDVCVNLPPDDAQRLKDKAGYKVSWLPLGQMMTLLLLGRQDPRLNDIRVRQALNYGVNKQVLADSVMKGFTRPEGQLVGKDAFGYNPQVSAYPYDPNKAKQLLADAGYPNGITLKFQSSQGRYSKQKEVSEALVGELAKIGVKLELEMLEWAKYVNSVLFDMNSAGVAYIGWNYYPAMDADFTIQHFVTPSRYKMFGEPKLDSLYAQSRAEFDPVKRKAVIQEFATVAKDQAPVVFLFQSPQIYGLTARVQNFQALADNTVNWAGVTTND